MAKRKREEELTHLDASRNNDVLVGESRLQRGLIRVHPVGTDDQPSSPLRIQENNASQGSFNNADSATNSLILFTATDSLHLTTFQEPVEKLMISDSFEPEPQPGCVIVQYVDLNRGPSETVLQEASHLFKLSLPMYWRATKGKEGFHVVRISKSTKNIAIQREVFAGFTGEVKLYVHRKLMSMEFHQKLLNNLSPITLTATSVASFVDRINQIVVLLRQYEICAGIGDTKLEPFWQSEKSGYVDANPYDEVRYTKTFRSHDCIMLTPVHKWRCGECKKSGDKLRARFVSVRCKCLNERMPGTLSEKELDSAMIKEVNLEKEIQNLIATEGVYLDRNTSEILHGILREHKLTPIQQLFFKQQYKMFTVKGASGMKWHPSMLRLALFVKSTSNASSVAHANSGIIKLSANLTLVDYGSVIQTTKGMFRKKLKLLGFRVQKLADKHKHQHYHSFLTEEVHISQKLVYKTIDGSLVGFVKLDEAESEMETLIRSITEGSEVNHTEVTKSMICMVKGCTNSIKEVVAMFPLDSLSSAQVFDKTWAVIRVCEEFGVKILAIICSGSKLSRSFVKTHTQVSPNESCKVDSIGNLCTVDKNRYFMSDPTVLIRSIRNCFAKSGVDPKQSRHLFKNGEYIEWKTIERLYKESMKCTPPKSSKLNAQNVYLTGSSSMKVSLATQVLNKTVGLDLKNRNWPGTEATVEFILKTNEFFENLRGTSVNRADKFDNPRLAPYVHITDKRFEELLGFKQYLLNWEAEVKALEGVSDAQKGKMTLNASTLERIYMSVDSFCGAVKFLLGMGVNSVNASVFRQDPFERYSD